MRVVCAARSTCPSALAGYASVLSFAPLSAVVGRVQMCNKKNQEIFREKREVTELIVAGKYDKARIRGEALYRKEREVEAYEVIELMCELLHERTVRKAQRRGQGRVALPCFDFLFADLTWCATNSERSTAFVPRAHVLSLPIACYVVHCLWRDACRVQGIIERDERCPPDLIESVSTVIWASSRAPVEELVKVNPLPP